MSHERKNKPNFVRNSRNKRDVNSDDAVSETVKNRIKQTNRMKKYIYLTIFVIIATLCVFVSLLNQENKAQKAEIARKSQNIDVLNDSVKHYRDKAGEYVATIGVLTYTANEYERLRSKDAETIKAMQIKLRDALNSTRIETVTKTEFREKLVYKPDSTVCFEFSDGWSSVDACSNRDSIAGTFKNREELFFVVHTKRLKKFLWWRWGEKVTNVNAKSLNPNTEIVKLQYTVIED